MAGMVRAMGATLTGAQNCMSKTKVCHLQFLEPFILHPMRPLNSKAATPQSPHVMQGVLHQHH